MNLKSILVGIDGLKAMGNLDLEISSVECDYRTVKDGSLFVAIKGFAVDGHNFIESAIKNGATAILVQEGCDLKSYNIPIDMNTNNTSAKILKHPIIEHFINFLLSAFL